MFRLMYQLAFYYYNKRLEMIIYKRIWFILAHNFGGYSPRLVGSVLLGLAKEVPESNSREMLGKLLIAWLGSKRTEIDWVPKSLSGQVPDDTGTSDKTRFSLLNTRSLGRHLNFKMLQLGIITQPIHV